MPSSAYPHWEYLDEVLLVYLGRHGRLSVEALQIASIGRQLGFQDLDSDDSIDQRINSLVDSPLSASGYVLQDLVSTYSLLVHSHFNLLDWRPRRIIISSGIVG